MSTKHKHFYRANLPVKPAPGLSENITTFSEATSERNTNPMSVSWVTLGDLKACSWALCPSGCCHSPVHREVGLCIWVRCVRPPRLWVSATACRTRIRLSAPLPPGVWWFPAALCHGSCPQNAPLGPLGGRRYAFLLGLYLQWGCRAHVCVWKARGSWVAR